MTKKITIVGSDGVGKSNYVRKLTNTENIQNNTRNNYIPTIGVDVKNITIDDTEIALWDTAGNEMYKGLYDGYWFYSDGFIIMYNDYPSLKKAEEYYRDIRYISSDAPVIFVSSSDYMYDLNNNTTMNVNLDDDHLENPIRYLLGFELELEQEEQEEQEEDDEIIINI